MVATNETAEEPLDLSVLRKQRALQRADGPDIVDSMIALFFASAKARLRDLECAAEADDQELLHEASHALTSAGANIGAWILASRCREFSQLARAGHLADATERVKMIGDEYRRAEWALLAYSAQTAKAA